MFQVLSRAGDVRVDRRAERRINLLPELIPVGALRRCTVEVRLGRLAPYICHAGGELPRVDNLTVLGEDLTGRLHQQSGYLHDLFEFCQQLDNHHSEPVDFFGFLQHARYVRRFAGGNHGEARHSREDDAGNR